MHAQFLFLFFLNKAAQPKVTLPRHVLKILSRIKNLWTHARISEQKRAFSFDRILRSQSMRKLYKFSDFFIHTAHILVMHDKILYYILWKELEIFPSSTNNCKLNAKKAKALSTTRKVRENARNERKEKKKIVNRFLWLVQYGINLFYTICRRTYTTNSVQI